METSSVANAPGDWFRPTRSRIIIATLLAIMGFLLPQKIPLEWYPLNEPGKDIHYLEICCASDTAGEVGIYYDLTRGMNELHSIRFPIAQTEQTLTYTFPLPDGPIVALHVNPPPHGATLTICQMRIINQRGEEILRFTRDQFESSSEIAAIMPSVDGWKLTSTANATNPIAQLNPAYPIIPVGCDHRNLIRCLLSTGYLTGLIALLLLAVSLTLSRPTDWRDFAAHLGFIVYLALVFAFVANRGLIRNSVHYARYVPPALAPSLSLEFDLTSNTPSNTQLFWDTGHDFNETESVRRTYEPHQGLQTLRFPLPNKPLKALRFDPRENEGRLIIRRILIVDAGHRTQVDLPLNSLMAEREITAMRAESGQLELYTAAGASDPISILTTPAIIAINQAIARANIIQP